MRKSILRSASPEPHPSGLTRKETAYGQTIFSQLTDFLPQPEFRKCVECYRGNHKIKPSRAGISFFVWPSPNARTGKVCAAFRHVCVNRQHPHPLFAGAFPHMEGSPSPLASDCRDHQAGFKCCRYQEMANNAWRETSVADYVNDG